MKTKWIMCQNKVVLTTKSHPKLQQLGYNNHVEILNHTLNNYNHRFNDSIFLKLFYELHFWIF